MQLPRAWQRVSVASAVEAPSATRDEHHQQIVNAALEGLVEVIQASERLGARPISWSATLSVAELCAQDGTDGLVLLREVERDHEIVLRHVPDPGAEAPTWRHTAHRSSRLFTSWTLFNAQGQILDRLDHVATVGRWHGDGEDETQAAEALPDEVDIDTELAFSAGAAYARRVVPTVGETQRSYFVRGDPRFGFAHAALRSGDWDAALARWRAVANDPGVSAPIQARALHNQAVYYELHGHPRQALSHVERAVALGQAPPRTLRYRDALRASWRFHRRLRSTTPRSASETNPTPEVP